MSKKRSRLDAFAQMLEALPACKCCGLPCHPEDCIVIVDEDSAAVHEFPDSLDPEDPRLIPGGEKEHLGFFCSMECVVEHWELIGYNTEEEDEEDWTE